MKNLSAISVSAAVGLVIGMLFVYEAAVRQPSINLIYVPAGEARQMPVEMLRLRPTMG